MSNRVDKPIRSPADLVAMLKNEKGITFNYIDVAEAQAYLNDKNNYLRTASYRKNYDKHPGGENEGKYIQLDFAYLVELSRLDMYLRSHLLQMCIDIEHALKVAVISDIEKNPSEDGYAIVDLFFAQNQDVLDSISKKVDSVFTGDLIKKYFEFCYVVDLNNGTLRTEIYQADCPVWVLVEILAFNDFLRFVKFYEDFYPGRLNANINLLNTVRNLRNACAHNNSCFSALSDYQKALRRLPCGNRNDIAFPHSDTESQYQKAPETRQHRYYRRYPLTYRKECGIQRLRSAYC